MSRRFLIGALGVLALGGLAALLLHGYAQKYASADVTEADIYAARLRLGEATPPAQTAPVPLPWKSTVRLAIGSLGLPGDGQNQRLGDLVTAGLTSARGLQLVERQELDAVLGEEQLSLSGLVRARDAVRVGKLLGADWFLLGTATQVQGTNCLVVRLVDTRTGILVDGEVVVQKPALALAAELAGFVRRSREAAAEAEPRVYLAIGAFEDLSVNNRRAAFPTQLRGYLTAAYQHSQVTLLEREYVDLLLQEMRLDLAGLTEGGATNGPVPLQSAFWLVDGSYQSYETTNLQVELTLDVQRIFGRSTTIDVKGPPGEPICRQVKEAIDAVMNKNRRFVMPTRMSEIRAQMARGREFIRFIFGPLSNSLIYADVYGDWNLDQQEVAKRRRNLNEAMRAFKTVLLLDPDNREAKMFLAICLRMPVISRVDEAREYYREIIEEPIHDQWSEQAKQALLASFESRPGELADPAQAARWFEAATSQATNSPVADFYRKEAERAESEEVIAHGEGPEVQELAKAKLLKAIRSFDHVLHGGTGLMDSGMKDYARALGTNRNAAAIQLAKLLPTMTNEVPELQPHLLAEVVTFQEDTNASVVAQFQEQLAKIRKHPSQVFAPDYYWSLLGDRVADWSFKHKLFSLAEQVLEGKLQTERGGDSFLVADVAERNEDRIRLAYAYLGMQRWANALGIFESFSNQPIEMSLDGPWGRPNIVLTSREANYCREKLSQIPIEDPREFKMGKACFCLCTPSTFVADRGGLWVGINGQLLRLDFDLKTNLVVNLPISSDTPISCLCLTSSNIWIGTDGEGLIDFDKKTRQARRLTEKDGLLMDNIACLRISGDALWIGYGRNASPIYDSGATGGLGNLNLQTGRLVSFSPSILETRSRGGTLVSEKSRAPSRPVIGIAAGSVGDIWFLSKDAIAVLRRYRARTQEWDGGVIQACTSLAADTGRLFVGQNWNDSRIGKTGPIGVRVLNLNNGDWLNLNGCEGLPVGEVTTLALDGNDLWVGGMGYIALVDVSRNQILKFAHVPAYSVDRIQIGGGYVWAQYDWHLHRAALADLR